jgi:hypothetical protein
VWKAVIVRDWPSIRKRREQRRGGSGQQEKVEWKSRESLFVVLRRRAKGEEKRR